MTAQQFKQRLDEKIDLQSVQEVLMARKCYEANLSVHLTIKAIHDRRLGIVQ